MTNFKETFVSPFEKDTQEEAFEVLDAIREAHPAEKGWVEIKAWVEKTTNGKWRAVRCHEKVN